MRALIVLMTMAAIGCGSKPATVGKPGDDKPQQARRQSAKKYQDMTAEEWGRRAKDADGNTSESAMWALHWLGDEGVPYLLDAAESQRNLIAIRTALALIGGRVDDADLPRLVAFLDDRYASSDKSWCSIRGAALEALRSEGVRAKRFAPKVKALVGNDDPIGQTAQACLKDIGG